MNDSEEQFEVRFRLNEDHHWYGEDGRDLLGRLFGGSDAPDWLPVICHHHPDGSLISRKPTVRLLAVVAYFFKKMLKNEDLSLDMQVRCSSPKRCVGLHMSESVALLVMGCCTSGTI